MNKKPTQVLIVEGSEEDAALIESYLASGSGSDESLAISRAPGLSTACQLLTRQDFDAAVLGLGLPHADGLEPFLKIRALRPSLPIIIMTSKKDEPLAARAVKNGAQDYFVKGSPDCCLLKRAIRYAIEKKSLQSGSSGELSAMDANNHFLGRISHEMRNTLATMKTAAYCLKDGSAVKLTDKQTQMVDMIARNIDRQAKLVDNILDLARFRSGNLKIQHRPVDVASILSELAEEHRLSRKTQTLQIRLDSALPIVKCDPDLIAQVLRNLLDNALRFAREEVIIAASKAGPSQITISVADDGPGIPEEHIPELFVHFKRLDAPRSANGYKGTGLGLAICKEIIEGHHGRIRGENAAGSGARFSFDLPVNGRLENAPQPNGRAFAASRKKVISTT